MNSSALSSLALILSPLDLATRKGTKRHSAFPCVDELIESLEEIEITKRRRLSSDPVHKITLHGSTSPHQNPSDRFNCMNLDEERDYSSLTGDVLLSILGLLDSMHDFMAFREVCRSWRRVADPTRYALLRQPPLLLCNGLPGSFAGLNFLDMNCHSLYILKPSPVRKLLSTLAYSHGFLISTIGLHYFHVRILLRNIFTGAEIRLPKTPEPFQRVRLSASPSSSECQILLFTPGDSGVQFSRLSESQWKLGGMGGEVFDDMLFLNGNLYALTNGKKLVLVDPFWRELRVLGEDDEIAREKGNNRVSEWMLAECNGELLLVGFYNNSGGLRVCKWDFRSNKWMNMSSLGGRAMFLSSGGFAGSIFPTGSRIRPNCVYYFNHDKECCYEFSLEDKKLRYPFGNRICGLGKGSAPIWVLPSLC